MSRATEKEWMVRFANDIRIRLKEKRIDQYELADITGLDIKTIRRLSYARGNIPYTKTVVRICKVLDIDMKWYMANMPESFRSRRKERKEDWG